MQIRRAIAPLALLVASACGGGGGGGGSSSPPPPPPPPPVSLSVAVSASSLDVIGREGASEATLTLDLVQTGSAATPIVPDVQFDASLLTLQSPPALAGGHYLLTFKSRNNLAIGDYTGTIQFRLCQQTACTSVYPNTTQAMPFKVSVLLKDWATFQRDAAHTGYVPLTVDTANITPAWGVYSNELVGFTRAAADETRVYFGAWGFQGVTRYSGVVGLDVKTGEPLWSEVLDVGSDRVGDPATANGKVFIPFEPTAGLCCNKPIAIFAGTDGTKVGEATFQAQGGAFLAPTPIDNEIISTSGWYGNVVYDHSQIDGVKKWEGAGSGYNAWHLEATAADHDNVYHYTGEGLDIFRRSDGLRSLSIPDPGNVMSAYDYWGAPMILSDGSVLAYSGTVSAERADVRFQMQRPLVRYRPAAGDIAWRTVNKYRNTPATHGGMIYAARNDPNQLDAIDVATGAIVWSWTPPDGTGFRSNIVVTDNVLFLSTSKHVYGINLGDRAVVFTYDSPGDIAIAPYNLLLISDLTEYTNADAQSPLRSAPRLNAFKLR